MFKIILFISSGILPFISISLIPTIFYSYRGGESDFANLLVSLLLISFIFSYLIRKYVTPSRRLNTIQGYGAVGLSWIFLCFYGTIPYVLSNIELKYIDILFETISGFTTTGSSIADANDTCHQLRVLEALSKTSKL